MFKKSYSISLTTALLAIVLVAGIGFVGGSVLRPTIFAAKVYDARAPEEVDLAPLFTAWNILNQNFAPATTTGTTTAEEKLYGAIKGLAASFGDDYTVFFPPAEKKIFDTTVRGDFEGVGMEIAIKNSLLTVVAPIKGTPAFRAGIMAGDRILLIDGTSTAGMPVEEAVTHIRGPKGTPVVFSVSRESKDNGKAFDVSVTRDTIVLPTIDHELLKSGVYVIHLYSFNAQSPGLFANALSSFAASGSDKLIIDLRNNPGGYLEAAVDIASWFLPAGEVVVSEDFNQKQEPSVYRSHGYSFAGTGKTKIAVLMDGGSASASEILAGALHDHGIATLVGTQSFGKGSVQQLFDVTADTSLKVTIARWLTPNGTSISHHGLTPDIESKLATSTDSIADSQLDRAVEFLNTGK